MKLFIVLGMCILAGIIVLVVVTREDSRDGFKAGGGTRSAGEGVKKTKSKAKKEQKTTKKERGKKRKDRHAIRAFKQLMSTEHSGSSS